MDEVTFPLEKTTADIFARWLEEYTCTTPIFSFYAEQKWFVLQVVRPSFPITRPTTIDIDAIELSSTAERLLGLISLKRRLPGAISIKIVQLDLDRVRVSATCNQPEVKDYFRELLISIAQNWPSAADVIARHFPPDLPPPPSLEKMALLEMDVGGLEHLLRRFAEEFAQRDHRVTKVKIGVIPRDLFSTGSVGPLTKWETAGWSIAFGTIQEFRPYDFDQTITFTEEIYLSWSLYVYPTGDCLELSTPGYMMMDESDDPFHRFIDAFVEELERLGLVRSAQARLEEAAESPRPAEDSAVRRCVGHPGLDHDELIYRLARAQEAEEIRAHDSHKRWKEIALELQWNKGTNAAGLALLRDARHRLKRLAPDSSLLGEIAEWRRAKKTRKT